MAANRYIGDYPVIGIRPCIDGRRGPQMMRESLEPTVWAMAHAAKKLFEENLFYSNGEPVKVVIADTSTIPEKTAIRVLNHLAIFNLHNRAITSVAKKVANGVPMYIILLAHNAVSSVWALERTYLPKQFIASIIAKRVKFLSTFLFLTIYRFNIATDSKNTAK